MGPPDGSIVVKSFRVRSGLMASQLLPWSVERNTRLPRHVENVGVMGRKENGIGPLEPVFHCDGAQARVQFGPDGDYPHLSGFMIVVK